MQIVAILYYMRNNDKKYLYIFSARTADFVYFCLWLVVESVGMKGQAGRQTTVLPRWANVWSAAEF